MSDEQPTRYEERGSIAIITLNRRTFANVCITGLPC